MKLRAPLLRARLSLALPPRSPFCAKPDIYSSVWHSQGLPMGTASKDSGDAAAGRARLLRAAHGRSAGLRWLARPAGTKQPQPDQGTSARSEDHPGNAAWQYSSSEAPAASARHSSSSETSSRRRTLTSNAVKQSEAKNYGLVASPPRLCCGNLLHPSTSGAAFPLRFRRCPRVCAPASATQEVQVKRTSWCAQPESRTSSRRRSSSD